MSTAQERYRQYLADQSSDAPAGPNPEQRYSYFLKTQGIGINPTAQPNPTGASMSQAGKFTPAPDESSERFAWGSGIAGLAPVASLPLTAILSGGGEAIQQLTEHATGSKDAPKTSLEAVKRIGKEAAYGATGGLAGKAVGKVAEKLMQRAPTAGAKEATDFAQQGMPQGGQRLAADGKFNDMPLMPAESTQSFGQTLFQNFAEGSMLGGGAVKSFRQDRQKWLDDSLDNFADQFGKVANPSELGDAIIDVAGKNLKAGRAPAKMIYNTLEQVVQPKYVKQPVYELRPGTVLDKNGNAVMQKVLVGHEEKAVGGAWVDTADIKKMVKPLERVARDLQGIGSDVGGDALIKQIGSLPAKIDFKTAQALRSRLIAMGDVFSVENKKAPALGVINEAASRMHSAIESGLGRFDPDARDLWLYANEVYKGANDQFNNEMIRHLVKVGSRQKGGMPSKVFDAAFSTGDVSAFNRVKNAVDPQTFKMMQAQATEYLFNKSMQDGAIVGSKLDDTLFGPKGVGKEMMDSLYTAEQQKWMKRFVQLAKETQKESVTDIGRMLIQLKSGGAAMDVIGSAATFGVGMKGTAGTIIFGPALLGQIFTRPEIAKLFVQGMTTKATAQDAGVYAGRIMQALFPRERTASRDDVKSAGRTQAYQVEQQQ